MLEPLPEIACYLQRARIHPLKVLGVPSSRGCVPLPPLGIRIPVHGQHRQAFYPSLQGGAHTGLKFLPSNVSLASVSGLQVDPVMASFGLFFFLKCVFSL